MSFFGELRRRNVFKVGAAYAIVAWLLAQVASVVAPALALPDWATRFVVFLLLLGFPVSLVLAWAYEVTPEGIQRTRHVPLGRSIRHLTGQKLNYLVTGLLALAVGWMALDRYALDRSTDSSAAPGAGAAAATGEASDEPPAAVTRQVLPSSVAVLPFQSLSSDPEDVYFAAGIHEEILNQLVKLSSLKVISRTTMMRYAATQLSIPEIARELNVQTVMEGSVRRAGDRVLVTVQLIDPETDLHLWSDSYQREVSDIFTIQADIATNVARTLEVELSAVERDALPRQAPTESLEAYELYLASLGLSREATVESYLASIERLDGALAIDQRFVEAWVAKSEVHAVLTGVVFNPREQVAAATNAALRAIASDPTSGPARAALSFALTVDGEWRRAREEADRARELGVSREQFPSYSIFELSVGDFVGARETLQANLTVDPMNHVAAAFLVAVHELLGDREARRAAYERGEALFGTWFGDTIEPMLRLGERDETFLRGADNPAPPGTPGARIFAAGQENLGAPEAAIEAIRAIAADGANLAPAGQLTSAAWIAYFGDAASAADLVRAGIARQPSLAWYLWLPVFDEVRAQPGFTELLREVGLPEYWREYGWPERCRPIGDDDFRCA